jgi:hypothetical protein
MPFKDPEKRRQFQREYKRKWRKAQEKIHPLEGFRIFICPRFPGLNIGLSSFEGGFIISNRNDVIEQVLRHPEYGRFIFGLAQDLTCLTEDK